MILRYTTRRVLTVSYTVVGLCFVVLVNTTTLPVALVAVTAAGVPGVVALIAVGHRLQTATPNTLLGRVAATFYTSDATAAVAGALIAASAIAMTTLTAAMTTFSIIVLTAGPTAAILLADQLDKSCKAASNRDARPTRATTTAHAAQLPRRVHGVTVLSSREMPSERVPTHRAVPDVRHGPRQE